MIYFCILMIEKPALQNEFSSTRITFNPQIDETKELRKRYFFFNITFFIKL